MRYDLKVLWVEDTPLFYEETKDILKMYAEEKGIELSFNYYNKVSEFMERMKNDKNGFKVYDVFFIDYSLSDSLDGSDLIKNLRKEKLDSDILFYSSQYESDIKSIVRDNMGSFEGVYIANRESFEDKSCYLINKNARRLTSLANVRGFLMDQTSENDFTMKSYILVKYDSLNDIQKNEIKDMILSSIKDKQEKTNNKAETEILYLERNENISMAKIMGLSSELLPLDLKYKIFEKMIEFNGEDEFKNVSITEYLNQIIKARNNLAHKKLDICRRQKYILYYDHIKQLEERKCPESCEDHFDDNKYSLEQWNDIRKKTIIFGRDIDKLQEKLKPIKDENRRDT